MKQVVCKKEDIMPGEMMQSNLGRIEIVVCRTLDGEFYAYTNKCIHQGASLSKGKLCGTSTQTDTVGEYNYCHEGEILRCPWHGREFDIKNDGKMLADPKVKLPSFQVDIEGDDVVVSK
ncbi:Rieske (2Fe-2S) protein [Aquibacillus sp. 3ASR75-11]|uniref:Rieske (2Fe-2S) protein n=1 Tax=Terrihalobacillus insolitus TaxID=2950438 RepID=A0A9X4AMA8_9BACI|nr:Rieske (2Fe-2S) protein [Terrihalobacillus insolitus]MDC3411976.1 Rieske (2Fe-2S) protein [Terrihalobacillus insolitus]MDC3423338.1 Rieske (2Fe-2S) protein [Terrihalobacillus insolitus]